MNVPFIKGSVAMQSNMTIDEVGKLISEKMFGGIEFQGLEKRIYDEVPAIFIEHDILGLRIVLSGYSGFGVDERFVLSVYPMYFTRIFGNVDSNEIEINEYLIKLIEYYLNDTSSVCLIR